VRLINEACLITLIKYVSGSLASKFSFVVTLAHGFGNVWEIPSCLISTRLRKEITEAKAQRRRLTASSVSNRVAFVVIKLFVKGNHRKQDRTLT
jgi:hypothetical protein